MKKKLMRLAALLLALVLTAALAACSLEKEEPAGATEAPATDVDETAIAVQVGTQVITYGEILSEYESMLAIYSYYGISAPTEASDIEEYQDMVVDGLIKDKLLLYMAEVKGIELDEDQLAAIQESYNEEIEGLYNAYYEYAVEDGYEDPDAGAVELINGDLDSNGWDMDWAGYQTWLMDELMNEQVQIKLEETVKAEVTVSDADVQAWYDEASAADAEYFTESPAEYITYQEEYEFYDGTPVTYVPDGFIRVRVITMYPTVELGDDYTALTEQMTELASEYGNLILSDKTANAARLAEIETEYAAAKAEADKMQAEYVSGVRTKAEAAAQMLAGGATFLDTLELYNENTDYATFAVLKENGELMLRQSEEEEDGFPTALREAVMALEVGGYTAPIEVDGVYYIAEYYADETPGAVALESIREAVKTAALSEKQETYWNEQVDAWLADESIVTRYESVYRSIGK